LTVTEVSGAKCCTVSAAASAAAKDSWPVTACDASGRSNSVAARLPSAMSQALPRRPRPAICRAAMIQIDPGSPASARRRAFSLVESSSA
jgi:hypothetical protein